MSERAGWTERACILFLRSLKECWEKARASAVFHMFMHTYSSKTDAESTLQFTKPGDWIRSSNIDCCLNWNSWSFVLTAETFLLTCELCEIDIVQLFYLPYMVQTCTA